MKSVSLKIEEKLLESTDELLKFKRISRNAYINEAIKFYNDLQRSKFIAATLIKEAKLVEEESMQILKEFENIDFYED